MSMRTYAALGGTALLMVAAPSAQAAMPAAFRIADTKVSKKTVKPGGKLGLTGKVINGEGRRARRPRVTISLRATRSSKTGRRLASGLLNRASGGRSRRFTARFTLARSTAAGRYYLFACVRPSASKQRPSCARHRIRVLGSPVPSPRGASPG